MSAEHTPGPWRFIEATQTIVSNQSHPIATLSDPFHRQCYGGKTGVDGPLIAAAPDLVAALQPFVGHNSSEETVTITVRTADVTKARAAITKATGSAA